MKSLVWFVEEHPPPKEGEEPKVIIHDIKLTRKEAALLAATNPKWVVYGPCELDIPTALDTPKENK